MVDRSMQGLGVWFLSAIIAFFPGVGISLYYRSLVVFLGSYMVIYLVTYLFISVFVFFGQRFRQNDS